MVKERPAYLTIADAVRDAVRSGAYPPGARLPSVRDLGEQWGVSLATAAESYRLLEREGYLISAPKRGFFVTDEMPSDSPAAQVGEAGMSSDLKRSVVSDAGGGATPGQSPWASGALASELQPLDLLSKSMKAMARTTASGELTALHPAGHRGLREMVARQLHLCRCAVAPEEIVLTGGIAESYGLALDQLCSPGDRVAVVVPASPLLLRALEHRGVAVVEIGCDHSRGPDMRALRSLCRDNPPAALVISPNVAHATGQSLDSKTRLALARLLGDTGVPVIEDDSHGELAFDGATRGFLRGNDSRVDSIILGGWERSLGPALACAWLACGSRSEALLAGKALRGGIGNPMAESMVAWIIDSGGHHRHLQHLRDRLRADWQRCAGVLERLLPKRSRLWTPQGGYLCWIELPQLEQVEELLVRAAAHGETLVRGNLFARQGACDRCLRFNVGGFDAAAATRLESFMET
ncbi:MAG: PLP-dependent aminotransferase family protein [Planctomycetota bacterium]|nr:PLP-dependent aminotransferase family protein [Planctomycetota bacterium]